LEEDVTVGIGVLCEGGECAVIASDMRATYGKTKVDPHDKAGKQFAFPPFNISGAIAGSPSSTHAVFSELANQLRILILAWQRARDKNLPAEIQFEHIRNAIEFARKKELRRLQSCAMESELGVSIYDWIAGKLPTGQPFNEYAMREGLRVLKQVKSEMDFKVGIILAGFLREDAIFLRGIGAYPIEESATPSIYVIGGKGAIDALQVLVNRNQDVEMGIARTLLHVYEALRAAKSDKGVGEPSGYLVIRPHTTRRPNGIQRIFPNHPLLEQWSKEYKLRDSESLATRTANDLINAALFPAKLPPSQWLGPKELMLEL
jgi:20S proteasome alpha/beta subunit